MTFKDTNMKKTIISIIFIFVTANTFCENVWHVGMDWGYKRLGNYKTFNFSLANLGFQHYFGTYGFVGIGLDTSTGYCHTSDKFLFSWNFSATPNIRLRIFTGDRFLPRTNYFSIKLFPLLDCFTKSGSDEERGKLSGMVFGIGGEITFNLNCASDLPPSGVEFFLALKRGAFKKSSESYFSISAGVRGFWGGKSKRERILFEKELREKQLRQAEIERQRELENQRILAEQERARQEAEDYAINSGSVAKMNEYALVYGYSQSRKTAIERRLSGKQNAAYRELLPTFDNPYAFDNGFVYYCYSIEVYQWISEYSFLAKVKNNSNAGYYGYNYSHKDAPLIFVETSDIKSVHESMSNVFLKATGTETYNTAGNSLKVVPRFELMLFE